MNKKFIQKISLLIFILGTLIHNTAFSEEGENYPSTTTDNHNVGFTVGANFDPYYFAPGVKAGYRINDYLGVHGLVQYVSSSNASNIPAEKLCREKVFQELLSGFSYKNLFTSLVLDAYPLENDFKVSVGVGYMDKTLSKSKIKYELKNKTKLVGLVSVGYGGHFLADQGFGYDIELGVKVLDTALENYSNSTKLNSEKSSWKAIPVINIALIYSF